MTEPIINRLDNERSWRDGLDTDADIGNALEAAQDANRYEAALRAVLAACVELELRGQHDTVADIRARITHALGDPHG